jgi:hypothetical protein
MADRRLGQAELLGHRRQLAVPEGAVQDHEQRQVEAAQFNIANISHASISIAFIMLHAYIIGQRIANHEDARDGHDQPPG